MPGLPRQCISGCIGAIADPAAPNPSLSDGERLAKFRVARDQIKARLEVLAALRDVPPGPVATEFHSSIRVHDLARSARFYSWLLGTQPREWTHRYVTFICPELRLNFVLLVSDGKELHHDTLYHFGIELANKSAVIDAYRRAGRRAGTSKSRRAPRGWVRRCTSSG